MFGFRMSILLFFILLLETGCATTVHIGVIVDSVDPFYSPRDAYIAEGVELYATWINANGGIHVNDSVENLLVQVVRVVANESANFLERVHLATRKLLLSMQIDVLVAPFSTIRTLATVIEWHNITQGTIPLLAPAGSGSLIYNLNYSNIWFSSAGPDEFTLPPIEFILERSQPNCSIALVSKRDDPFWNLVYLSAIRLLSNGTIFDYPDSSSDDSGKNTEYSTKCQIVADLEIEGTDAELALSSFKGLAQTIKKTNADVLIIMGVEGFEASVYSQVLQDAQIAPKAIVAPKPIEFIDSGFLQGRVPEYWIFSTFFHRDRPDGQAGKYMGTPADFFDYYHQQTGNALNSTQIAYSAAVLVAWQLGVERAGLSWQNATSFTTAMYSLSALDAQTETFWGETQFDSLGRSVGKHTSVVQYVSGQLQLVETPADLIYPAPWPWNVSDDDSMDTETTIGIVVGSIAAFACVLVILTTLGVVGFMLVKRVFFHMILLPKGNAGLE